MKQAIVYINQFFAAIGGVGAAGQPPGFHLVVPGSGHGAGRAGCGCEKQTVFESKNITCL